ncbi:hypothetical protein, partial [Streptomyces sp. BE303]|uniref:hypothetical protein n=1 Tax=Streptomyces sp. BE303 TaxID=3002528 RepID=UPI002E75EA07
DEAFWDPIDRGDTAGLASRLGVPVTTLEPLVPALASWRARGRERSLSAGGRHRATVQPVTALAEAAPRGRWAIVGDEASVRVEASEFAEALTALGADAVVVPLGDRA